MRTQTIISGEEYDYIKVINEENGLAKYVKHYNRTGFECDVLVKNPITKNEELWHKIVVTKGGNK